MSEVLNIWLVILNIQFNWLFIMEWINGYISRFDVIINSPLYSFSEILKDVYNYSDKYAQSRYYISDILKRLNMFLMQW